jgi:WhiB family redox-sensing transcriptional regulator
MRVAACKDYDTNIFYPAPGDIDNLRLAKSICKECVSRHECLDYALSTSERFGIWGGKSARERMLILRAQRLLNRNTDFDDPRQIDTPPPSE